MKSTYRVKGECHSPLQGSFVGANGIRPLHTLILIMMLWLPLPALASIEVHQFQTPEQEELYNGLITELRCLVCQNQNLADSNAELARDLRDKTYELVMAGSSRSEIIDYMVTRYGDFVLYKPPVKESTLLLWAGPLLFFLIGLGILFAFLRRRTRQTSQPLSKADRQRAEQLLSGDKS